MLQWQQLLRHTSAGEDLALPAAGVCAADFALPPSAETIAEGAAFAGEAPGVVDTLAAGAVTAVEGWLPPLAVSAAALGCCTAAGLQIRAELRDQASEHSTAREE